MIHDYLLDFGGSEGLHYLALTFRFFQIIDFGTERKGFKTIVFSKVQRQ